MRGFIIDLLYALSPPHPFMCAPCTIIYGKDIERLRKMIFIRWQEDELQGSEHEMGNQLFILMMPVNRNNTCVITSYHSYPLNIRFPNALNFLFPLGVVGVDFDAYEIALWRIFDLWLI